MKYPIQINRRKIIVTAQIKGVNDWTQLKLILDTGSSKTIIGERAAVTLGFDLKRLKTGDRLTSASGNMQSKILRLPKLSLFGKDMVNFEVSVVNFPSQIMFLADGLIGMDFLMQFKSIGFDFDEKTIEITL